jgi:hypothetical protein
MSNFSIREARYSRWITAAQVAIALTGIGAIFLPAVGAIAAVLGFVLYRLSQKREEIRAAELRETLFQDVVTRPIPVTINGKPVMY